MYSDDNFYQISKLNKKVAELAQRLAGAERLAERVDNLNNKVAELEQHFADTAWLADWLNECVDNLDNKVAKLEQGRKDIWWDISYSTGVTRKLGLVFATLLKGTPLLDKAFYGAPNPTPRHVLRSEFGIKFPDDTEANSR